MSQMIDFHGVMVDGNEWEREESGLYEEGKDALVLTKNGRIYTIHENPQGLWELEVLYTEGEENRYSYDWDRSGEYTELQKAVDYANKLAKID